MPKHASNEPRGTQSHDDRIGLTQAFEPIDLDSYEQNQIDESKIGLTQAFQPISTEKGVHASGFSYQGDNEDEYPDAFDSLEPVEAPALLFDDAAPVYDETQEKSGRHGKVEPPPIPVYMRKSRRTRRVLIVVILLIFGLIGAGVYYTYQLILESQNIASEQVEERQVSQKLETLNTEQSESKDVGAAEEKITSVPDLVSLVGLTKDQAVEQIGRGAVEVSAQSNAEEGAVITTNLTYMLMDEPTDTRSGTPMAYLGLNSEGVVVQAGYSTPVSLLGYGSLSFYDLVETEHIIETTLQEVGLPIADDVVTLPVDKAEYSEYKGEDNVLAKESYSFSGEVDVSGVVRPWSSVLLYDYSTVNITNNLDDTIRTLYVYVN